jgi:hypothetical protein
VEEEEELEGEIELEVEEEEKEELEELEEEKKELELEEEEKEELRVRGGGVLGSKREMDAQSHCVRTAVCTAVWRQSVCHSKCERSNQQVSTWEDQAW